MAQLLVRNLEQRVVRALKERARRQGRSAEAEHREILRQALITEGGEDPKSVLLEMPDVGDDEDFERLSDLPRDLDL